jgi:dolichol-phosphate mannosyltransferase
VKIVVVAPVYNESETLPVLYERLAKVLSSLTENWELILVNDGSRDDSWDVIQRLRQQDSRVKAISLARNFGQQPAFAAGLHEAQKRLSSHQDVVITMDSDLQHPPELIADLLRCLDDGYHVAYAIKRSRREPFLRRTLFSLFHAVETRLAQPPMPRGAGMFAAMRRPVLLAINSMPERTRYMPGLRAYAGFRQIGVEFDCPPRFAGKPQQTFAKLMRMALDAIFAYSFLPARLASLLGLVTAAVALVFTAWVLYQKWFTGQAILGWASTMVSHLFLGAVQLICIGILGEYIARIYEEVRRRPLYIVAERLGLEEEEPDTSQG